MRFFQPLKRFKISLSAMCFETDTRRGEPWKDTDVKPVWWIWFKKCPRSNRRSCWICWSWIRRNRGNTPETLFHECGLRERMIRSQDFIQNWAMRIVYRNAGSFFAWARNYHWFFRFPVAETCQDQGEIVRSGFHGIGVRFKKTSGFRKEKVLLAKADDQ